MATHVYFVNARGFKQLQRLSLAVSGGKLSGVDLSIELTSFGLKVESGLHRNFRSAVLVSHSDLDLPNAFRIARISRKLDDSVHNRTFVAAPIMFPRTQGSSGEFTDVVPFGRVTSM